MDKWFYFYVHRPREPVVVWVADTWVAVHPGTNRLIGRGLRDNDDQLPAIVITEESTVWPKDLSARILVDRCDLAWPKDLNNAADPAIQWAVGSETTFNKSTTWTKEVYAWISENLRHVWALKYQNRVYCVNWGPHRGFRWGIAVNLCRQLNLPRPLGAIVDADNYDNLSAAVQALFETIVEQEGIRLQ